MTRQLVASCIFAALATTLLPLSVGAQPPDFEFKPTEARVPVGTTSLFARVVGSGRAVIVLHGGPDFDQSYFLPDLDQMKDGFRLIYYDQRGRGKSAEHVRPEDVTLLSDVDDLGRVSQYFRLDAPVLLGHSWGAVLALEYALRHPTRVSYLILMNPAPVSTSDVAVMRKAYRETLGVDLETQHKLIASAAYQRGDPDAVIARYRIHFEHALARVEDYEKLMARMQAGFIAQGKGGIIEARAVEDQLMRDTWDVASYDLLPKLRDLRVPTLIIAGDHDFIPPAIAEHIAQSIPNAHLVTIKDCGHFAFLECAADVRNAIDKFFRRAQ